MKRTLDEIELEEIESFYIDCNTLIIRTKTEENSYQYSNQLELLRKISYFMHRYEIEYNRKEEQDINQKNAKISNLTVVQKKCQKKLKKSNNIAFNVFMVYMLLIIPIMIFPNMPFILFNIFFVIEGLVLVSTIRNVAIMKDETLKQKEKKQNYDLQIEKGFKSLKEASLSYLNKIRTVFTTSNIERKDYIEEIERGFQKRIGIYPQQ